MSLQSQHKPAYSLEQVLKICGVFAFIFLAMYFGKILLVPLFFAILISFVLYPICKWMERKGLSRGAAIMISLIVLALPITGIGYVLVMQVIEIGQNWTIIWQKINAVPLLTKLIGTRTADGSVSKDWLNEFLTKNSSEVFSGVVISVSSLVQIIVVPLYVSIILTQRNRLIGFFENLLPENEAARFRNVLQETVVTYYNFVKGMLIVYLVVGILNSVGLALLGVPHAVIYGFTASIMTFIPYVGIMIAAVMPMITAWALNDSIYYPLAVAGIFAFVQVLEANLIFPLAVSNRIRVNMLFTLFAIFLGGIIWGAAGMILFVPFVAIIKLIADRSENYKHIGLLLGDEDEKKTKKVKPE